MKKPIFGTSLTMTAVKNTKRLYLKTHIFLQSQSNFSLKRYLVETIIPKKRYAQLFLCLVVLKASSYWIISLWQHPEEPLSVLAMYRVGDIQYYQLIAALSKLQFGESILLEHLGEGISSFPYVFLIPHALGLRLFGASGFIVADILVAISYYVVLTTFLRTLGISKIVSESVSVLVVSEGVNPIFAWIRETYRLYKVIRLSMLALLGVSVGFLCWMIVLRAIRGKRRIPGWASSCEVGALILVPLLLLAPTGTSVWWGFRIPRPFVTEVVSLCCLCLAFILLSYSPKYRKSWKFKFLWFCLGLSFAALLQSDIYTAETVIILVIGIMLYLLFFSEKETRLPYIKGMSVFWIVAVIANIPVFIQRLFEHPDAQARLGMFPIDRMKLVLLPGWAPYFAVTALSICGLVFMKFFRERLDESERQDFQHAVWFLVSFCIISCLALPALGIVLGKGIQLYHFSYRFRRAVSFTAILFFLYALSLVPVRIPDRFFSKKSFLFRKQTAILRRVLLFLVCVICLGTTFGYANRFSQKNTHVRDDFVTYASLPDYRRDFLGVIHELLRRKAEGRQTIGTFDYQVYSWWVTFGGGYSVIPDANNSPGPDRRIELRLGRFCKLLNMDSSEFNMFINDRYVNYFWLGSFKYKVSALHTLSPTSDYDPEILQARIQDVWILGGKIYVSESEQNRLVSQYDMVGDIQGNLNLDIVVLTNDEFLRSFQPPHETFRLSYQNSSFRIWIRK